MTQSKDTDGRVCDHTLKNGANCPCRRFQPSTKNAGVCVCGHSALHATVEKPGATEATNDVVTEARAHIARLKADMRGVDTGCTNSYDTSLLGSLCAEIERLRAVVKEHAELLPHGPGECAECDKCR